jgi:fibronectin-binding autotransporter adhesin
MATPVTETATFDSQVVVPDDGVDFETAASLLPAFQSLADRTRALKFIYDLFTSGGTVSTPISFAGTVNAGSDGITSAGPLFGQSVTSQVGGIVSNTDVDATRDVIAGRNLGVTGNATIGGTLGVTGTLSAASLDATNGIVGSTLIAKKINEALTGVDADHTYLLAAVDTVVVPEITGTITADHNYTIDLTGAATGMTITFANYSSTHTITLNGAFEGSSTYALKNSSSSNVLVTLVLIGSLLYPISKFANP